MCVLCCFPRQGRSGTPHGNQESRKQFLTITVSNCKAMLLTRTGLLQMCHEIETPESVMSHTPTVGWCPTCLPVLINRTYLCV